MLTSALVTLADRGSMFEARLLMLASQGSDNLATAIVAAGTL
jgi:hypothetical protein